MFNPDARTAYWRWTEYLPMAKFGKSEHASMSSWMNTNLSLRRRGLRIGIPSVVLLVAGILLFPHVRAAREAAREAALNSHCEDNFFQHSGWHPSAVVRIHQDGTVAAGCCQMCFTPVAPILYVDSNGDVLNAEELSDRVVEDGKKEIERVRGTPEFQKKRLMFSAGDETRADESARSSWDDFLARSSSMTAKPTRAPD